MLRHYQQDLIDKTRLSIQHGHKHICICAPCGAGKSFILRDIIENANKKHNQVLILVHRIELKDQLKETFSGLDFEIELYQTATRHIDKIKEPKIIICDESHLSLNKSYYRIFEAFPNAILIGTTATPVKNKNEGLGIVYDDLIIGVSTKWLIENNYLAPYEYYSLPLLERKELDKDWQGEYVMPIKHKLYGDVIETYKRLAEGKKTIVFASSIQHSKELCELFKNAGYAAFHLDCDVSKKERKKAIEDFRTGKIQILCNFLIIAEGLSVSDCECCILCKPTSSISRYLQSAMRCMRYQPNKTAIIIDHCQNYLEHGMVDDDRSWSLAAQKKKRVNLDEQELTIRTCLHCYRVYKGSKQVCPYCGFVNAKPRKEIETEEKAELERIEKNERKQRRMQVGMAQTREELMKIAKERGYSPGWVYYMMKVRNDKK